MKVIYILNATTEIILKFKPSSILHESIKLSHRFSHRLQRLKHKGATTLLHKAKKFTPKIKLTY